MRRSYRVYVDEHADGQWEALCIDLDIAVQGRSFEETLDLMKQSILSYLTDAAQENEADRKRLLNRRAPFGVRMAFLLRTIRTTFTGHDGDASTSGQFLLPCTA